MLFVYICNIVCSCYIFMLLDGHLNWQIICRVLVLALPLHWCSIVLIAAHRLANASADFVTVGFSQRHLRQVPSQFHWWVFFSVVPLTGSPLAAASDSHRSCLQTWPTYAVIGWLTKTLSAALLWLVQYKTSHSRLLSFALLLKIDPIGMPSLLASSSGQRIFIIIRGSTVSRRIYICGPTEQRFWVVLPIDRDILILCDVAETCIEVITVPDRGEGGLRDLLGILGICCLLRALLAIIIICLIPALIQSYLEGQEKKWWHPSHPWSSVYHG